MNSQVQAVFALGGNHKETLDLFSAALLKLEALKVASNYKISNIYETPPLSPIPQDRFLNAAFSCETSLTPKELFNITEEIERSLGKKPKPKDAARPIDIDFLFYGDQEIHVGNLIIPHPRWKERLFVLYPLSNLFEKALGDSLTLIERINGFPERERQGIILRKDLYARSSS